MNLKCISQHRFDSLEGDYKLIVAASGYETRARYIAERLGAGISKSAFRMALAFDEHREDCARPLNDNVFKELGYDLIICKGSSANDVVNAIEPRIKDSIKDSPSRILVDISSMTRPWYGALVRVLSQIDTESEVLVDFVYTPAKYLAPCSDYPPNQIAAPIPGFTGNTLPDKPTALVMGLGFDRDRALGLKDYLDPQLTLLFCANPSTDSRYVDEVNKVNCEILKDLGAERTFTYAVRDSVATFNLVESVCNGLKQNWRVVLCSFGPKIFGLCCFLVAAMHRDLSIWRVSADHHETPVDHLPEGEPIVIRTEWVATP